MKFKKILCCFVFLQFFLFAAHSYAKDTDLYVGSESTIEPNVLIIFDNSGSMKDKPGKIAYCVYDPTFKYDIPTSQPTLTDDTLDKVYRNKGSGWFALDFYKNTVGAVPCVAAQTTLTTPGQGLYVGKPGNTDCTSPSKSYSYATGRYLRYLYADKDDVEACTKSKAQIAKEVVKSFLSTITGMRIGLMHFNYDEGGYIKNAIRGLDEKYDGSAGNNKTHREHLKADIDAVDPETYGTWTPLAETMYEAGLYFKGAASYFNSGTNYTSPAGKAIIDGTAYTNLYCQKNYVILMTDGISTVDVNSILETYPGDWNSDQREPTGAANDPGFDWDGSDFLDDVTKRHCDEDFHSMQGTQNIVTYTIGFELDSSDPANAPKAKDLLQRAATLSHGKFYTTAGAGKLADAFANVLNEVLAKTSSFVAPIVPVSKMERTTAGDKIYLAFFRPNQSGMWSGNIKKYGVQQTDAGSLKVGDILDASGSRASDDNGVFYSSSISLDWTKKGADGGEVERGGVGEVLQNRTSARNIYTILSKTGNDLDQGTSHTDYDLTNAKNAFTTANTTYLTYTVLGVTSGERDNLINFVRGIDVYDDNVNGKTDDKRDWMLGSFLHSRPCIINYKTQTVIYAGANDGMLHAFDDATGEELWGFIPPNLLGRLQYLHAGFVGVENPIAYVDGSPKAYVTYDSNGNVTKAILIFGLRRGGNYYYGLDVTNPAAPRYAYRIYEGRKGSFNDIGQTWSTPVIAKVPYGSQTTNPPGYKWVAIFGAGYHKEMDEANPNPNNITSGGGRGMYMADVLTGDYFWGRSGAGGQDPVEADMDYPIPSDIATIDLDGDGRIDRIYVGDTNANIWKFKIGDLNKDGTTDPADYTPSCEWTIQKVFKANPSGTEKTRMFYPPDVTFERDSSGEYEMLFFGTGDREDPKGTKDVDFIYAFKDKGASATKGKSDLTDVSDFYSLNAAGQKAKLQQIASSLGWYIKMEKKSGEKILSSPVVYAKTAYFTSFSPSDSALVGDLCYIGEGTASLYAVNWSTGEAAFNLDDPTNLGIGATPTTKSDRTKIIGSAIPSGVVITVIGGKVTAYIGVGGGVVKPPTSGTRSLFPVTWKLVF